MADKLECDRDGQDKILQKRNTVNQNGHGSFLPETIFLAGVTFASMVGGFGYAIGQARRRSPEPLNASTHEGVKLALRALGWGTVLAVSGVGLLVLGVKTVFGVKDAKEFGIKMKNILPAKDGKFVSQFDSWRIPRNNGGRSDEN
ncbi:transmembrane protein 242-like [Acropora millepora]|uniref:transmembrane protein 242-like n=1 Tax=Acropora millepora TaxID=45264 RepID=UPI0010FC9F42|nr:transmembrane protein 242-like [Acropora millepora]